MAQAEIIKIPTFAKYIMRLQVFLLRRNWMGKMGNFIMVLTVKGRKTGKEYTTPIGYLRAGQDLIAFNKRGTSNWYHNLKVYPDVKVAIKGQELAVRAREITDPVEREQVFQMYRQQLDPKTFARLFEGVSPDAPAEELQRILALLAFVRFTPR